MSTRMEKWAFRIGVLGLIALVAGFVWQQTHEERERVITATSTTTASTAAGGDGSSTTTTAAGGEGTATTAPASTAPPGATTDPGFVVTSPADGSSVDTAEIEIVGNGPAGEIVHLGSATTTVGEDSVWRMTVTLQPGPNALTFTVLNSDGTPLYTTVSLTYAAPETTSTTESAAPLPAAPSTSTSLAGSVAFPAPPPSTTAPPPPTTAPPPPPTTAPPTTAPPTTAPPTTAAPTTTTTAAPTTTTSPDG